MIPLSKELRDGGFYPVRNNAPLGFESRYSGTGISNGVYPVVALNSALRFIKPLPREGWLSNQCRHLDQINGDPVE